MKKILFILITSILTINCSNDIDYKSSNLEFVGFDPATTNEILEDSDEPFELPIYYGGKLENAQAITVTYEITGGSYGVDYTIEGEDSSTGTITISPGKAGDQAVGILQIRTIPNTEVESDVVLTVTLTEVSIDNISLGYPLLSEFLVKILDDDCPFDKQEFLGDFEVDEPGYGEYDVNFVEDPNDPNVIISNNFWDYGGIVRYVFNPNSIEVTLPTQVVIMGGTEYVVSQGEGNASYNACSKSFVVPYIVTENGQVVDSNVHFFTKK